MRMVLAVVLAGLLGALASGCSTERGFGHNSLAELKTQAIGFADERGEENNDLRLTWRRYIKDERESLTDVVPQLRGFRDERGEEANDLKLTWDRYVENQ